MQTAYLPSRAPAQQPVRVRLSCDSCSAAKVKCDRRRPACERCSSNQLHCTYSVSRRHGCKRRIAYEPAVTAHGAANIAQQSSKGGGYSLTADTKRQARDTADILTYNNNEVSGSSTGNDGITFHNRNDYWNSFQYLADDDFTTGVEVDDSEFSAFAFGNSLPTPCDSSQNTYFPPSQQEPGQAPWTPIATPSTTSIDGEDPKMSGHSVAQPAASEANGDAFNRPKDSLKTSNQAASNEIYQEVHDCEAYALTLLRSLDHPLYSPDRHNQIPSSNQACAVPETDLANSKANPEVLHSLDTILHANKCALSGVVKLLDCSCAQRPHLATLYMSIITKMLSLYETAASTDISSQDCLDSASPANATHSLSGPRLARITVIQVGVFHLDEEDQATLQRGILLQQLRKTERAIEKFASLSGGDANDYDISVRQWHSVASSMLKKELQRIYQNCKERLQIIA